MLDEKSRKLLIELDYNARDSLSKIGKKLRLSKDATINRLKKLEEEEYVKGYYSVINYALLGYTTYRLYVQLNGVSSKLEDEIKVLLKEFKQVRFISFLSGEYDVIITFQVKFSKDLDEPYKVFCDKFSSKIVKKELACITKQKHFLQPILKDKEKNKEFITKLNSESLSISKLEEDIIKILALNARKSFVDLSLELGKKPNTFLYSLRGLEKKGVVIGYRPRLDFNKLGLSHYLVRIQLKNNKSINFEKLLVTIPGIIYVSSGIASYDYELELVLKSTKELRETLSFLSDKFQDDIAKTTSELILSTHALNYCPF